MEEIKIQTKEKTYPVYIGHDIRFEIHKLFKKKYTKIFIVTDQKVANLYLEDILHSTEGKVYSFIIPEGEESKSLEQFLQTQTKVIEAGLDRESVILALGGGVVGDLAGFVAATYMRGIDYIQVPTTILAHDSSVGGKVAINHPLGKNLIGNFYHPEMVIYDVSTLSTLSEKEIRSGYAEIIKHGLIADQDFYNEVTQSLSTLTPSPSSLVSSLKRGIQIKARIVEEDVFEKGVRSFLNLGHTLGHAIEAEMGYGKITHGEAVAIGIDFALKLSARIFNTSLPMDSYKDWMQKLNYPTISKNLQSDSLLQKMKMDKKTIGGEIRMVLLKNIGNPVLLPVDENLVKEELINFTKG
ncbi:3-dehydroquinate synthase [Bacillaceae bacterium S4-13-58]